MLGVPPAFATIPSADYDLSFIDLKVLDVQILEFDDRQYYPLGEADLLKVTVNVTNNGIENFGILDKMFKIIVMNPDFIKDDSPWSQSIVDNYFTTYNIYLETKYDQLESRELFDECQFTNVRIKIDNSKVFTVCFDILRSWNNEVLNIDGEKQHYLVMMNNQFMGSCPNCIPILLTSESEDVPSWLMQVIGWHSDGLISIKEFENTISYLKKTGVIDTSYSFSKLDEKNNQLKNHQTKLADAHLNLYVSTMKFYDFKHTEEFSGALCKQQNNIVTISADYSNPDDTHYDVVFFKLLLHDGFGNVIETGISKIVDVTDNDFRHFSVSTPYDDKFGYCSVVVDSKF